MAHDPRAIANLLLDEAASAEVRVTNLALQKLIYFAHGTYLLRTNGTPLVSGYFEAWPYGPVHPAVYRAFKGAGSDPIRLRAVGKDPLTGKERQLPAPEEPEVLKLVAEVIARYGMLTPGHLVNLSHAKGSPWHAVMDKARTGVAFGMRISDDVIISRFQHHKVTVDIRPLAGEPPGDDTPFA